MPNLLDAASVAKACVPASTASASASATGSGSEESCKYPSNMSDCFDSKYNFQCKDSGCKTYAQCVGKQMCKGAAAAKDPAACRKAIEGMFEANCDVKCDDPTLIIIIVIVVVVLLLGFGIFCYCRGKQA